MCVQRWQQQYARPSHGSGLLGAGRLLYGVDAMCYSFCRSVNMCFISHNKNFCFQKRTLVLPLGHLLIQTTYRFVNFGHPISWRMYCISLKYTSTLVVEWSVASHGPLCTILKPSISNSHNISDFRIYLTPFKRPIILKYLTDRTQFPPEELHEHHFYFSMITNIASLFM